MNQSEQLHTGMNRRTELIVAAVYLVFFSVGTLGHYLEATRALMLQFTPYVLLVFGVSAIAPLIMSRAWKLLIWVAGTYVLTFALEALGVATGLVFGAYDYGSTLGLKVLSVPVIIGFNWVIVVLGCILIAWRIIGGAATGDSLAARPVARMVAAPLLVGALAVVFDLVLEPVAMRFDYWQWAGGRVPLHNYIAWFIIATVVSLPIFALKERIETRLPTYFVLVQFLFMASLLPLAFG